MFEHDLEGIDPKLRASLKSLFRQSSPATTVFESDTGRSASARERVFMPHSGTRAGRQRMESWRSVQCESTDRSRYRHARPHGAAAGGSLRSAARCCGRHGDETLQLQFPGRSPSPYIPQVGSTLKSSCDGEACQTRTTQRYERQRCEMILDEVEHIAI